MNTYKFLIDQEVYVIQHQESQNYFFDGCKTSDEAIKQDWEECFFISEEDQKDSGQDEILSYEEQRDLHASMFEIYTKEQLLNLEEKYGIGTSVGILTQTN